MHHLEKGKAEGRRNKTKHIGDLIEAVVQSETHYSYGKDEPFWRKYNEYIGQQHAGKSECSPWGSFQCSAARQRHGHYVTLHMTAFLLKQLE